MSVRIVAHSDSSEYVYTKTMPEDVDPAKSKVKFDKDRVKIVLCKQKPTSWSSHYKFLIEKN